MLSMRCSAGPWSPSGCQGGPGERREKGVGVRGGQLHRSST